jgi:hypothetical protein
VVEGFAYGEFSLFSSVPLVNWAQVTNDSAVDFTVGSADWALTMLAVDVTVG